MLSRLNLFYIQTSLRQSDLILNLGMKGGEKLGVTPALRPKDMADPSVDHLGVMSYIAGFQWLPPRAPPGQRVSISWENSLYRKGDQVIIANFFHTICC